MKQAIERVRHAISPSAYPAANECTIQCTIPLQVSKRRLAASIRAFLAREFAVACVLLFRPSSTKCCCTTFRKKKMHEDNPKKRKFFWIIVAYPFVLLLLGLLANLFLFGVEPAVIALPSSAVLASLAASALMLLVNHAWLMTGTELTRLKYDMHATPEEWVASGRAREDVSKEGLEELDRHHNAHMNATENIVYFAIFALLVGIITPVVLAAQVWIVGFAIGRLGHSFSYLTGRDGLRGIFMSVSLVSLGGLASYLAIALLI